MSANRCRNYALLAIEQTAYYLEDLFGKIDCQAADTRHPESCDSEKGALTCGACYIQAQDFLIQALRKNNLRWFDCHVLKSGAAGKAKGSLEAVYKRTSVDRNLG